MCAFRGGKGVPWKLGFDGYRRGSVGIGVSDGVGVGSVGGGGEGEVAGGGGVVFLVGCGSKLYMYAGTWGWDGAG